jgi:xanthine dehydrogenase YagS FAD-binding subunit
MQPFAYSRPTTVSQALLLAKEPRTVFLAGGTEILNWMRLGITEPHHVVDIGRLQELEGVRRIDGGIWIGALTKLNDVALHPDVVRDYPVLSQAILKSASAQLRNLATVGGNPLQRTRCSYFRQDDVVPCNKRDPGTGCSALEGYHDRHAIFGWTEACVATHPADPPVALAALDAIVLTLSVSGPRRIPVKDLILLPTHENPNIDTILQPGELITGYEIGGLARNSAYLKIRERESYEYATVSCAVSLDLNGSRIERARVALGSVAHKPWRLLETEKRLAGTELGSAQAVAAVEAGLLDARPLPQNAYKVRLARNAVLRTLQLAGNSV